MNFIKTNPYCPKISKEEYIERSKLEIGKHIPIFGDKIEGYNENLKPCIKIDICGCYYVLDCDYEYGEYGQHVNSFTDDEFIKKLDKLVSVVVENLNKRGK